MNPIITPDIIYRDMYECWMIRNSMINECIFEVRSMYKPNEAISIDQFVAIWNDCVVY